jgi:hypothetical protein
MQLIVCQPNFLYYPKKLVARVFVQKALANATNVLESIHNEYGLNYGIFEGLQYRKFFNQFSLINCLYNIKSSNSLEPVFVLWHSMGLLRSPDFLYEYALLIFFIYKDVLLYIALSTIALSMQNRHYQDASLTHLVEKTTEFYKKIESLPLHEIILIINLLSEEVPHIIQENMGEPSSNWYEWLRSHVWKISLALFTLFLKILIIFKDAETTDHMQIHIKPEHGGPLIPVSPKDILKNIPKKANCISRILCPLR